MAAIPILAVHDGEQTVFLRCAFGAEQAVRIPAGGGRSAHCDVRIGAARLMLAGEPYGDRVAKIEGPSRPIRVLATPVAGGAV